VHAHQSIERRAARTGVRVVEVDEAAPREIGIERDPEQPAFGIRVRACRERGPGPRLQSARRPETSDANAARTLGDEEAPIWRERDRPRRLQSARDQLYVLDDGRAEAR